MLFYFILLIDYSYTLFINNLYFYFDNSHMFVYFNNLLLIYFIYFFFKLILISSMFELLWSTHFFNKKNNISISKNKSRLFLETFLKLNPTTAYSLNFNLFLFKFLILN